MSEVPDKAIYRCPEHGLFMVETGGIIWRNRSCPHMVSSVLRQPCGILSPLASVDDPGLTDKDSHIGGVPPETVEGLRQAIAEIRALREKSKQEGERPNFFFGGSENRRNGRKLFETNLPEKDVEQELFEVAERERMRAAINENWDDSCPA